MNVLIYDENEVNRFLDEVFPTLEKDEVLFINLFQRNKHISAEDRVLLDLPRSNVIDRMVCHDKKSVVRNLRRWETHPGGFLTKSDSPIPNLALVPYITTQPVSTVKAYQEFNRIVTEYLIELGNHRGPKENKENTYNRLRKLDTLLLDCHQHAYSRKYLIDIDYDGPKDAEALSVFEDELMDHCVTFYKVETNGGFHYLLRKESISYNYTETVEKLRTALIGYPTNPAIHHEVMEVEISNNNAIPIPGCYQYGKFPVKLLDKVGT